MKFIVILSILSVFQTMRLLFAQSDTNQLNTLELPIQEILNQNKSNEQLEDVNVITTNRTSTQKSSKAPASIVIITSEQINQRGYQSLLDVLQDMPNVKVEYGVDPRWMHDVSIRGLVGMDKFVLLLDGVRISSPTNDIIPVTENYPVHFAKQIEIVFGPASALYGADAFAGVINIISKEEEDLTKNQLSVSGGMYNSFLSNFAIAKKINDKVSLIVSGQYFFDQQPRLSKFYPQDYKGIEEGLQSGTFQTIFGIINPNSTVFPEESQTPLSAYAIQANLKVSKFNFQFFQNQSTNPSTMAGSPNNVVYNRGAFFGHKVTMLSGTYNTQINKWQFNSFLVGSRYDLNPESNFRNVYTGMNPAYQYSVGWMLKAEQLVSFSPNEKFNLTAGITYEKFFSIPRGHDTEYPLYSKDDKAVIIGSIYPLNPEGIEADIPRVSYSNIGAFLQAQYNLTEALTLTVGARYDNNTRFGGTFNPRAGLVFEISPKITLKGLYGTAFLAPSPYQAFNQFGSFFSLDNGQTYQSSFFRLPNPNLKPQLVQTFELSSIMNLSKNFRFQLTGFYSGISGLFAFTSDNGNTNLYNNTYKGWSVGFIEVSINQGKEENYGGNFLIDYSKQITEKSKISGYLSASYITGKTDANTDKEKELAVISPWMLKAGFTLQLNRWTISPRVIGIGEQNTYTVSNNDASKRQKIQGYLITYLFVQYRFNNVLSGFLNCKNLLDIRYRNINLGASPESSTTGAAQAEIANGAPQNPIRLSAGINLRF